MNTPLDLRLLALALASLAAALVISFAATPLVKTSMRMPWATAMTAAASCRISFVHHFRGRMSSMTPAKTTARQPRSMPRTCTSILANRRVLSRKPRNMARPPSRGMG